MVKNYKGLSEKHIFTKRRDLKVFSYNEKEGKEQKSGSGTT